MNAVANTPFSIAGLTIDPFRRRVAGPGGEIAIQPMVMQLLLRLAGRAGDVIERRALFDDLWGSAQVGDDSLNRLVAELRKALDGVAPGAVQIETVPRVGYRFVAGKTVAPTPLARRAVVAGGAAVLIAAAGGAGLWRARGTRQHQARQLTERGSAMLFDAPPMQAADAVPTLRQALALDPGDSRALGLLALALETSANNGGSASPGTALRDAAAAAQNALALDPAEPHAQLAMLDLRAGDLDWVQMEDGLEHIRRSAPSNPHVLGALASFLQAAGRTSRSWTYNERAAAVVPASPTPQWRRALRLWTAGRTDRSLALSERLLPLWPHHALVWNARFMTLAFSGRTEAAAALLRAPVGPSGNPHPARAEQWEPTLAAFADPRPALVERAKESNLAAARSNPAQAAYAAMALSQLGALDEALAVTEGLLLSSGPLVADRPVEAHSFAANAPSWCRTQWLYMPPMANARADARFGTLCEKLGLSRYWRDRGVEPDTRIPV